MSATVALCVRACKSGKYIYPSAICNKGSLSVAVVGCDSLAALPLGG